MSLKLLTTALNTAVGRALFRSASGLALKTLSRRGLLKASGAYIAVPYAVGELIDSLDEYEVLQDNKELLMLGASLIAGVGPNVLATALRSAGVVQGVGSVVTAASLKAAAKAAVVVMKGKVANVTSKTIALINATTVRVKGAQVIISIPNAGDLIFEGRGDKLVVLASTAVLAAIVEHRGFATTPMLRGATLEAGHFGRDVWQIASAVASDLVELQREELEEEFMSADPIAAMRNFNGGSDHLVRHYDLLERSEITAAFMRAMLAGDSRRPKGTAMHVRCFTDVDGDELICIDGTSYRFQAPAGIVSDATVLEIVKPAAFAHAGGSDELESATIALIVWLERIASNGGVIPMVMGDAGALLSEPELVSTVDSEFAIGFQLNSDGVLALVIYSSGLLQSARDAYAAAKEANAVEWAVENAAQAVAAVTEWTNVISERTSAAFDALKGEKQEQDSVVTSPAAVNVATTGRLQLQRGEMAHFSLAEFEEVL